LRKVQLENRAETLRDQIAALKLASPPAQVSERRHPAGNHRTI
jgi:hypothetical protein